MQSRAPPTRTVCASPNATLPIRMILARPLHFVSALTSLSLGQAQSGPCQAIRARVGHDLVPRDPGRA